MKPIKKPDPLLLSLERLLTLLRSASFHGNLNPVQWETLRYLSRCNRISDSPKALTDYLGATKGTVSQTLNALVRKGLVAKAPREGEARSLRLSLTDAGKAQLQDDPYQRVARVLDKLDAKTRKRLGPALARLVSTEAAAAETRSFGVCRTCRFFREKGADSKKSGPHLCLLFEMTLSKPASRQICAEHVPS